MALKQSSTVWDLSTKNSFQLDLPSLNDSQLLVKIEKVFLDCDLNAREGVGQVVQTGKYSSKLKNKQVTYIQRMPTSLIQEYEIIDSRLCQKNIGAVLLHNAHTAIMIKEFVLLHKFKRVLHITENKVVSQYLKNILNTNIVNVVTKKEIQLIKIFDFDIIIAGKITENLNFSISLPKDTQVLIYDSQCKAVFKGGNLKKVNPIEWFGKLSKVKQEQYKNYIKNNEKAFEFKPVKIQVEEILKNQSSDYFEVLVQDLITNGLVSDTKSLGVLETHEIITSMNSSIIENDQSELKIEDLKDLSCMNSPLNTMIFYTTEDPRPETPEKTQKFTFSDSTDQPSQEYSYDFLQQLIEKYRNQQVESVLAQFESVFRDFIKDSNKYLKLLPDYSIYEGDLNDLNQPSGFGSRYFNDGTIFRGQWESGQASGKGLMATIENIIYYGEWKRGQFHGYGTLINENGDFSEGYFKRGEMNGYGIQVLKSGEKYQGEFRQGLRDGKGCLQSPASSSILCEYDLGMQKSSRAMSKPMFSEVQELDSLNLYENSSLDPNMIEDSNSEDSIFN